jgi:TPR repeat protein
MADVRWRDAVIFQEAPTPRMLITGRGVPPLDREAAIVAGVEGYWQLGQRGQSDAQAELGYLFAVGLGVPQNDEWAAYWYGQAALQDWPDAKLALAAMYAIGRGVPQDDRAAAYWLFRSQNLHLIADAYACGFGVEQDFEYARELYEMMADRGSADAQYQLGNMYVNVCGAPLNDDLASKWFQKAADAGHPEAQIALSEMMSRGWTRGIPDPWQAYVWVELALTRLPDEGPPRTRALAARDRARAMLSPEQQADVAWLLRTMLDTEAELQAEALKSLQSSLVEVLK